MFDKNNQHVGIGDVVLLPCVVKAVGVSRRARNLVVEVIADGPEDGNHTISVHGSQVIRRDPLPVIEVPQQPIETMSSDSYHHDPDSDPEVSIGRD